MKAANSAGELGNGTLPSSASFSTSPGPAQHGDRVRIDLGDDLVRRPGGRDEAAPVGRREAGVARLGDGRHVGKRVQPPERGHHKRTEPVGVQERHQHERVADEDVDLTSRELRRQRRGAIGHDRKLDAGAAGEKHGAEMSDGAVAGMSERHRLRTSP